MKKDITSEEASIVTRRSYNDNVKEYIAKDHGDGGRTLGYWPGVEAFLNRLPKGTEIFEVGSGAGSDARRIEAEGYTVIRSDVVDGFLRHLKDQGHVAVYCDILKSPTKVTYDAMFANAVFLHFPTQDFRIALTNIHDSLQEKGLFCFGMKLGDFDGWREKGLKDKRYFKFWKAEDLQAEITAANFEVVHYYETPDHSFAVITVQRV